MPSARPGASYSPKNLPEVPVTPDKPEGPQNATEGTGALKTKCGRCDKAVTYNGERYLHDENGLPLDECPPKGPNPRVSLDDDGTLDDFYATDISSVHFEAIDQSAWYAVIHLVDGRIWQLNFGAKNDCAKGYALAERVR